MDHTAVWLRAESRSTPQSTPQSSQQADTSHSMNAVGKRAFLKAEHGLQQDDSTPRKTKHIWISPKAVPTDFTGLWKSAAKGRGPGVTSVTVTWLREDCAGASPAALICSADPRQGWKDFPPKPSYPPAEQKSPPILTRSYCRDALHSETKSSSERGEEKRGEERKHRGKEKSGRKREQKERSEESTRRGEEGEEAKGRGQETGG